jgi:hypothetical protein
MPVTWLFLLALGAVAWIVTRDSDKVFQLLLHGYVGLFLISFLGGLLLGNVGREGNFNMGQFLATRPMTDTQMARITLHTIALSVLVTWLIWVAAFLIGYAIMLAIGAGDSIQIPIDFSWWQFAGSILAMWIIASVLATIGMAGSNRLYKILIGLIAMFVGLVLFSELALSNEYRQAFLRTAMSIAAGVVLVGTAWAFWIAHRRALIQAPTVLAAACLWAAATVLAMLQWPPDLRPHWFGYLLAAAVFALAVAPLAAAPLALSMNRHR